MLIKSIFKLCFRYGFRENNIEISNTDSNSFRSNRFISVDRYHMNIILQKNGMKAVESVGDRTRGGHRRLH